jgi:hypothetical protein
MKKMYKNIFAILLIIILISNQGCEVQNEILNNYFLNLPLKQGITATGSNTTIFEQGTFCLSDYDDYENYIEEIQSIKYLAALYRTLPAAVNPSPPPDSLYLTPGLVGEKINITVIDGDGNLVFSRDLPTAAADDYVDTPYEIELTGDEIIQLNEYLAGFKDPAKREFLCFTATITMNNIPPPPVGETNTLTGQVEVLLELEILP